MPKRLAALDLAHPRVQDLLQRLVGNRLVGREADRSLREVNPSSDSRAASTASGLNGNTLRWFLLALKPSSGRPRYMNAGIP
jgi:hypothetical protein